MCLTVPPSPVVGVVASHIPPILPQVGRVAAAAAIPPAALYVGAVVLVILMLIAPVVWAAVWSEDPERRKAAKDVLDSLLKGIERIVRAVGTVLRSKKTP